MRRVKAKGSLSLVAGALLLGALVAGAGLAQGTADVSRAFGSWEEWRRAYDELVSALEAFEAFAEARIDGPERLLAVMEARDRIYRTAGAVEGYLYLRLRLDSADEEARSREHLTEQTDGRWSEKGRPWFEGAMIELGSEEIGAWMAVDERLRRYEFFFRRFFDGLANRYPEGQESFLALSRVARRQASRVHKALAVAEAPAVEVTLESGEVVEVGPARARTIFGELGGARDRQAVSRGWLEALGRRSQTYAALLEGIVQREKLLAEARAFDSPLDAQLRGDGIPASAVRNVIRVAREVSAPLRRYHVLRRRVLGLEEYGLADRFVPLDAGGRRIGFDEARTLIVESAAALGPEVEELVESAFADGWIDSVERPGKWSNASATFVAGEPFVLVNYRGSLENLFQLAHELGHAVHSSVAHRAQPFVYEHPSTLTGETVASVFEGALVERVVGRSSRPEERAQVLDLAIQNVLRLFYRPMLDADFELRIYDEGGPMTGPALAELYRKVVEDFYGDSVELHAWDGHAWQQTPHYYTSPLYMGRYGLSTAAANALTARLTSPEASEAATARRAVLELMRAGSSAYPLELLSRAGADLDDARTVEALAKRLDSLVDELERALAGD